MINLINLIDNRSDFCGNSLFTDNTIVRDFLNLKQLNGDWESCQIFPCSADLEGNDCDVDGSDLSFLANDLNQMDLSDFALDFGSSHCIAY
jgi:hypothetical protein